MCVRVGVQRLQTHVLTHPQTRSACEEGRGTPVVQISGSSIFLNMVFGRDGARPSRKLSKSHSTRRSASLQKVIQKSFNATERVPPGGHSQRSSDATEFVPPDSMACCVAQAVCLIHEGFQLRHDFFRVSAGTSAVKPVGDISFRINDKCIA